MSKKSNKNKKQPKVSSIVGVPFIYDQAQMERVEKDIVDNYGGDVFKAFLKHPYVDIHTDKQGIYVGEKRGQYPFKKVYDNLYAYLFWTKNSQLVNDVAHQMVEKKPSMIKRYPELIRWARAQVLNMVADQYGIQPICNIPEPQTERIDDATTIIERYGGRVSDELSTIAIELSKAGAPDTVIYDIVSNTCDKIDTVIAQQKETIGNYIEQNNLISEEVEDTFTHAQEHHHDCHCAHCEERFHNDNLTDIGCETYCENCRDELFIQCDNCEEYEPNDRVFCCEGCGRNFCLDCEEEQDGLCSECYEEREEEENDEC